MAILDTDIDAMAALLEYHEADVTNYDAGDIRGCLCGWSCHPMLSNTTAWKAYFRHAAEKVLEALE